MPDSTLALLSLSLSLSLSSSLSLVPARGRADTDLHSPLSTPRCSSVFPPRRDPFRPRRKIFPAAAPPTNRSKSFVKIESKRAGSRKPEAAVSPEIVRFASSSLGNSLSRHCLVRYANKQNDERQSRVSREAHRKRRPRSGYSRCDCIPRLGAGDAASVRTERQSCETLRSRIRIRRGEKFSISWRESSRNGTCA